MSTVDETRVPFRSGHTWVRITRPDSPRAGALPLVVLHGGPGFSHDYLRSLAELADATGRTVVHYDQYGCGRSTHEPDAPADFWTPELFVEEFHAVLAALGIERAHVLGQSWGGMLGAEIAVRRPANVASLQICNSPAAMDLWSQAAAALREELPAEVREALERHEADGSYDDPEYLAASHEYDRRHVVRMDPTPQDYLDSVANVDADPTVYHTMNGPNEFHVIGTMRDWTIIDRLPRIAVPTLVLAGEFDEAQPVTWQPFVEHIPGARSVVIADASHCSHLEKPEEFRAIVTEFLAEADRLADPDTATTEVSA